MNWIDAVLGAVVLLGAVAGWRRGFAASATDLVALAASVVAAFVFYPHGVAWLEGSGVRAGVWAAPVVFAATFVVVRIVLGALFGRALRAVSPRAHGHVANRALGTVPGAANGLVHATVAAAIVLALPADDAFTRSVAESEVANRLAGPAEWLETRLTPIFDPAVRKTLARLVVQPGSRESIRLPYTVADGRARPDLEARMLELVNDARRGEGLRPLQADAEAAAISRAHSRDMLARGYFSHVTPDGVDPGERARRANLAFRITGENLALARTLPMAHQGLLDSPGHRANILRPAFGRLGIGVIDAGRYGLMVTQTFRN